MGWVRQMVGMQDGRSILNSTHSDILRKIRNIIVQTVAEYKLYQITNQALAVNINSQFTSYLTKQNYPFVVNIIGINVKYPTTTVQPNDTLGLQLLKQTSKLSQLDTQLTLLQSYITSYSQHIQNYVLMHVRIS